MSRRSNAVSRTSISVPEVPVRERPRTFRLSAGEQADLQSNGITTSSLTGELLVATDFPEQVDLGALLDRALANIAHHTK